MSKIRLHLALPHMYVKYHCLFSASGEPVIDSPTAEFSGFTLANLSVILTITGTTPTVQVYREGVLIDNPRVKICFANTQFEMIISDLQRSDAGQYRIVATNHFDMAETTITVVPIGKQFCTCYNYVMCMWTLLSIFNT